MADVQKQCGIAWWASLSAMGTGLDTFLAGRRTPPQTSALQLCTAANRPSTVHLAPATTLPHLIPAR